MIAQEFIELLISNGYSKDDFYDDGDESVLYVHNEYEDIIVKLHLQVDKFDIYQDFPYAEEDPIGIRFSSVRSDAMYEFLCKEFGEKAEPRRSGKYCIFNDMVGLFGNRYNEKDVIEFLKCYLECLKKTEKINYDEYMLQLIKDEFSIDEEYGFEKLAGFLVNQNGTHAVASHEKALEWLSGKGERKETALMSYIGYEHIYFRSSSFQTAISLSSYKKQEGAINELFHGCSYGEKIEITNNGVVIISNKYFSSIHMPFRGVVDLITAEFREMKNRALQFKEFSGIKIWEEIAKEYSSDMNFNKLTAAQFEQLCIDILELKGYQEVKQIGKTNAPDGGIDIIATETIPSLLKGIEQRKWLFQCKRSKKTLDRKEIQDIAQLLKEKSAERYGLFCSNSISPNAIARLMESNKETSGKIQWFSKPDLERLLKTSFPQLILKYKLME